jgi:hypothetical protein
MSARMTELVSVRHTFESCELIVATMAVRNYFVRVFAELSDVLLVLLCRLLDRLKMMPMNYANRRITTGRNGERGEQRQSTKANALHFSVTKRVWRSSIQSYVPSPHVLYIEVT